MRQFFFVCFYERVWSMRIMSCQHHVYYFEEKEGQKMDREPSGLVFHVCEKIEREVQIAPFLFPFSVLFFNWTETDIVIIIISIIIIIIHTRSLYLLSPFFLLFSHRTPLLNIKLRFVDVAHSSRAVTQSNDQAEPTPKDPNDDQDTPLTVPPNDVAAPVSVENHHEERQPPPSDIQTAQSGNFLSVGPVPMYRSSR